ncbi:Ferredoxin thioredoxin reductase beta chain [Pseudodesulfovibrio profundus]|mgnify:CR=1 FL=1|uniref:ferredoxin:thioredoxin reductase n=1 Tax=Pseudodesulfovibrio profundus TaxID=57320 RepID=A0A2C8F6S9_9BACT|nr:ferredoxin-thioredoxin reductase catalytic domain-containing protein [Pseudodesulfovibrio profundus]SOB57741.1 Ferredoxin thioredoxin reductase beta chain [Pseudodesulfovibrio profundus]|tara:strand:- start:1904 stop:2236 length:333 start_codon:yes stop_codon:yes gene_type:complete
MNAEQLYDALKKIQEPKGYYFNKDMEMTMPLIESLLTNKERLGYMACPCRLANGEIEADKDIICPCTYREEDIKEYGACFCALYVSKEYNEGTIEKEVVPERRPADKILF